LFKSSRNLAIVESVFIAFFRLNFQIRIDGN